MKKRIRLTEDKFRKIVKKCVNEEVMHSNAEDAIRVLDAIWTMWRLIEPMQRAITKLQRSFVGEFTRRDKDRNTILGVLVESSIELIPYLNELETILELADCNIREDYNLQNYNL